MSKEKPEDKKSKVEALTDEIARLANLVKEISEVQLNHEERLKELEKEMW